MSYFRFELTESKRLDRAIEVYDVRELVYFVKQDSNRAIMPLVYQMYSESQDSKEDYKKSLPVMIGLCKKMYNKTKDDSAKEWLDDTLRKRAEHLGVEYPYVVTTE